jgi:small subunit ribosomal protein S3Ae
VTITHASKSSSGLNWRFWLAFSMGKTKQTKGKGAKKVKQDTFLKKEWRHVFVPGYFEKRDIGFTISHKTARGKQPLDYVNNRTFLQSHQDLSEKDSSHAFRIFTWRSVDVQENDVLTVFAGARLSVDKLGSLLRKYRTLIDAQVDVRTADGYILRAFSIAFTKKLTNKKACYAKQSKKKEIRNICIEVMRTGIEQGTVKQLCEDLIAEKIEKEIVRRCETVFQVEHVFVTKIKVLKAPQLTSEQVRDIHHGRAPVPAQAVERPAEETPAPAAPA